MVKLYCFTNYVHNNTLRYLHQVVCLIMWILKQINKQTKKTKEKREDLYVSKSMTLCEV